ncbi:MAG: hypothetical protein NWF03_09070, partial [Candidatus Bathyarchaeota archaeon]|nr:hypothetical protein [Candidatus Bathyarchaeota archaeon]
MSTALKKAKSIFASREPIDLAKSLLAPKESVEQANTMFATKEPVKEPEQVALDDPTVETVHESKLMLCLKILCTLVSKGPMREKQLKHEFKMDETRLKSLIRLLWNRGLVEEEKTRSGTEPRYVVTERGTKVLKVIGPIIKEAH